MRRYTEPIIGHLPLEIPQFERSLSDLTNDRLVFKGISTVGVMIICTRGELAEACDNYNNYDRRGLANDSPFKICGLSYDLVKKFPEEVETNPLLKSLMTDEMKAEAKKHSRRWEYGKDFIFRHCIDTKLLDHKIADNFHLLCQIVIPSKDWVHKYPNIDLTNITGKTSRRLGDCNIIDTLIRETREELGIQLSEYRPNGKLGILHAGYQYQMRKKYNMLDLIYDFKIGGGGSGTHVFVLVVDSGDLTKSQIFKENSKTGCDWNVPSITPSIWSCNNLKSTNAGYFVRRASNNENNNYKLLVEDLKNYEYWEK